MSIKEQTIASTHSFDLADVEKYGSIEKALIIKEIRSLQIYKLRNGGNGWVYYSSSALEEKFPYMSGQSIKRRLKELVEDKHLETTVQNKVKFDRTMSYRLPILSSQNGPSTVQNGPSDGSKMNHETVQNGPTIPSHSSHSSHSADGLANKEPAAANELEYLKAKSRKHVKDHKITEQTEGEGYKKFQKLKETLFNKV